MLQTHTKGLKEGAQNYNALENIDNYFPRVWGYDLLSVLTT